MQSFKHELMRETNMLNALNYVRRNGPVTRRDVSNGTGISWGAVSNIINDLLEKKILVETKSNETMIGRTPSELDINAHTNYYIGVDINIKGLTFVVIDLKGRMLLHREAAVLHFERESVISQVKAGIASVIGEAGEDNILGIGVALQGSVDVETGVSVFSPYFSGWIDVPVKAILEEEFGIPVFVEHDPNCMMLTEQWLGASLHMGNLLFIRLSMGIGMSMIVDGKIYRGADGCSGEFGHITVNLDGERCSCGKYGCLEAYASGRIILQKVREGVKLGLVPESALPAIESANFSDVIDMARHNEYIRSVFLTAGVYLGIGISTLVNLFNPETIIVGGEIAGSAGFFMEQTMDVVKKHSWQRARIRVVQSEFGSESAALGAATLFVQKLFEGDPETLTRLAGAQTEDDMEDAI